MGKCSDGPSVGALRREIYLSSYASRRPVFSHHSGVSRISRTPLGNSQQFKPHINNVINTISTVHPATRVRAAKRDPPRSPPGNVDLMLALPPLPTGSRRRTSIRNQTSSTGYFNIGQHRRCVAYANAAVTRPLPCLPPRTTDAHAITASTEDLQHHGNDSITAPRQPSRAARPKRG